MVIETYPLKDVFTPTKPARIAFIDRDSINEKLVNSLNMPGKQLIVYGHSGSGKTTLLVNKLHQLYERHITTHCMKGMSFEQIIINAFDELSPYYVAEKSSESSTVVSAELSSSYNLIKTQLQASSTSQTSTLEKRILPPQLTPQALGKFLGATGHCWILEDFHKIDENEKIKLAQLMKVFMDLSDTYEDLKIIALGAVGTARQVVEYDSEMNNRVAEIHVELMTDKEIESIVSKGEDALNVTFDPSLKPLIAKYSNGLASVCHHICMYMCQAAGITETIKGDKSQLTKDHFEKAIKSYISEASDSIQSAFDKALKHRRKTKFEDVKIVLETLSSFKERGASRIDILNKIRKSEQDYPEINLKNTLAKLKTEDYGSLVRFDQTSGLHSFSEPIHRVYALAYFHQSSSKSTSSTITIGQLIQLFSKEFASNMNIKVHEQ